MAHTLSMKNASLESLKWSLPMRLHVEQDRVSANSTTHRMNADLYLREIRRASHRLYHVIYQTLCLYIQIDSTEIVAK